MAPRRARSPNNGRAVRAKRRPVPEYRDAANGRSRPDIRCLGVAGGTDFLELSITHALRERSSKEAGHQLTRIGSHGNREQEVRAASRSSDGSLV